MYKEIIMNVRSFTGNVGGNNITVPKAESINNLEQVSYESWVYLIGNGRLFSKNYIVD